ncbi:MAG: hypothetical protein LBW85_13060 [Deltaproteobacteria bacterium]|jgi:hypothetical protein|nr:hypothetical protein [Deltaproteobacteria bacterium]
MTTAMRGSMKSLRPFTGRLAICSAAFAAVLILGACGPGKNPILGEWDVTVRTGNSGLDAMAGIFTAIQKPSVSFTETEMRLRIGDSDQTRQVTYTKDDDGNWSVCFGAEGTQCQRFTFSDEARTRASFTVFGMELGLVKKPEPQT